MCSRLFICLFLVMIYLPAFAQPGGEPPPVQPGQIGPPNTEAEAKKAYETNAKKERINGVYIPKDVLDAHIQLTKLTDSVSLAKVRALSDDEAAQKLRKLSLWMILNWNLYDGSRIGLALRNMGITYPEDQAEFLCVTWHRSLNGKDLGIKALVEGYKSKHLKEAEERRKKAEVIEVLSVKRVPPADSTRKQ